MIGNLVDLKQFRYPSNWLGIRIKNDKIALEDTLMHTKQGLNIFNYKRNGGEE